MTRLVFVYGTLMSGEFRASALERAGLELEGPASVRGNLYSVHGSYPALVPGSDVIVGEVWRAPDDATLRAALRVTDMIEGYREFNGHPDPCSMYLRVQRELEDGRTAIMYQWNSQVSELEPIGTGSWREYASRPGSWR